MNKTIYYIEATCKLPVIRNNKIRYWQSKEIYEVITSTEEGIEEALIKKLGTLKDLDITKTENLGEPVYGN